MLRFHLMCRNIPRKLMRLEHFVCLTRSKNLGLKQNFIRHPPVKCLEDFPKLFRKTKKLPFTLAALMVWPSFTRIGLPLIIAKLISFLRVAAFYLTMNLPEEAGLLLHA